MHTVRLTRYGTSWIAHAGGGPKGGTPDGGWPTIPVVHRTAFWQALGNVLRTLWHHEYRVRRSKSGKGTPPPPQWWTVRGIPEGRHADVIRFLGGLDRWVNVLYPDRSLPDLNTWTWELERLVGAVMAARPASDVAEAWRRSERPGEHLMVPGRMWSKRMSRTLDILGSFCRVSTRQGAVTDLTEAALAHLHLAGRDEKLGRLMFPGGGTPRIVGADTDLTRTLMMGVALGCAECIDRDLAAVVAKSASGAQNVHDDSLSLSEYGTARRIVLGSGGLP